MEKIKKITLNKEEQQTLKNYYKIVEEFQEFACLADLEEAGEWITELALNYCTCGYSPRNRYSGVEIEMEKQKYE